MKDFIERLFGWEYPSWQDVVIGWTLLLCLLAIPFVVFADLVPVLKPCEFFVSRSDIEGVSLCVSPREQGGGMYVYEA